MIVGIISYFIGFFICMALNIDYFFTCLLLCYALNTGIVLIITTKWKISVHTTGLSGPVGALILLLGPICAFLGILYPVLVWSRVLLKKHTMAQAIAGAVQGFFLKVIEMYIFIHVFNLPITNIIGLYDACLYIFAIIFTPILLGLLSYIKVKSPQMIFIAAEIILWALFLVFMPLNVFIIFAAVSITAIGVSFYAGDDFIWYTIISGQSFTTL